MNLINFVCGAAKRFVPHKFTSTVKLLGDLPRILISKTAYDIMYYIVSESPEEVSWLGKVQRQGMNFLIEEVYLFDQEVHSTQTALDPDSVGAFFAELAGRDDGVELVNNVRFWGHSHVNMGVTPSGSYGPGNYGDLSQMHQFGESSDYFIMGIANKSGNFRFEIFFYDLGIKIEDVEWEIFELEQADLRDKIKTELSKKVRKAPPPVTNYESGNWNFGNEFPSSTHSSKRTTHSSKKGGRNVKKY